VDTIDINTVFLSKEASLHDAVKMPGYKAFEQVGTPRTCIAKSLVVGRAGLPSEYIYTTARVVDVRFKVTEKAPYRHSKLVYDLGEWSKVFPKAS